MEKHKVEKQIDPDKLCTARMHAVSNVLDHHMKEFKKEYKREVKKIKQVKYE